MQVDRMIFDPSQGNSHVAESQGRECAAGALFHPGEMGFTNLISQVVEAAGLVVDFTHTAHIFIIEGIADLGEEGEDLLVESA